MPDEMCQRLFLDFRAVFGSQVVVVALGKILDRWGFIDLKLPREKAVEHATRYVTAFVKGGVQALLLTREELEKEKEHQHVGKA